MRYDVQVLTDEQAELIAERWARAQQGWRGCRAATRSGLRCRRALGTRNAGAELCGLHELARRRAADNMPGGVPWRGWY